VITIIDTGANLARLLPVLDQMVDERLITTSDLKVIKYVHRGGTDSQQGYVAPLPPV
jgi:PII-like signaling protein